MTTRRSDEEMIACALEMDPALLPFAPQLLQDLEELCRSFPAVDEAYALQAGREVRIMVHPDRANDDAAAKLAYDIARAVEEELNYPGEIKVNVIRRTQFTESAK